MSGQIKFGLSRYAAQEDRNGSASKQLDISDISSDPATLGQNETPKSEDEVDAFPRNPEFSWFDVIALLISIGTFLVNTGTDLYVVYIHYVNGYTLYFTLTLVFVLVPTLTMTGFSLRWYIIDSNNPDAPTVSPLRWTVRIIFLLLQLGPTLRYMDAILFAGRVRKSQGNTKQMKRYYKQMCYEEADVALLRLFESFLEAAPQLVLQLYIIAQPKQPDCYCPVAIQVGSMVASLTSLAWSLVAQHRALRLSIENVKNMSWPGSFVQFLWRVFVIGARVLALGLFASMFPVHLAFVLGLRWLVMTIWIATMKTEFCDTKFEEYWYNAVLGGIFLFCYFNPKNDATRWRYFFYYLYTLTENSILIVIWYVYSSPDLWYRFPAILSHFLSFFMGILFMVLYYLLLHPSGQIKLFSLWGNNPPEPESVIETPNDLLEKTNSYDSALDVADIFEEDLMEPRQPRKNRRPVLNRSPSKDKENVDYLKIMAQIHHDNQSFGTAV